MKGSTFGTNTYIAIRIFQKQTKLTWGKQPSILATIYSLKLKPKNMLLEAQPNTYTKLTWERTCK